MVKNLLMKLVYSFGYLVFLFFGRIFGSNCKEKLSIIFLDLNNRFVLRRIKNKRIERLAILLPHCIQNYKCPYKITSDIENCRSCGLCKVGELLRIKNKYDISIKVATGGTLARRFIMEERPQLIVAVACERDLISGIYDSIPFKVYGIFNRRPNGPCIDTDLSIEEVEKILKKVSTKL